MSLQIAIVTHNVVRTDGQGRVIYEIARHGLEKGARVHLLADTVAPELLEMGAQWIPVHPRVQKVNLLKVWEFARRANLAVEKIRGQVDIVHGFGFSLNTPHQVNTSQFVHSAWRRSPAHTARQNRNAYGAYHWLFSAWNARWERQAYQKAQRLVAASQMVRRELNEIGLPDDRMQVIRNGVDLAEFYPGPADRKKLGLPEEAPLALFVGDVRTPRKNLDTVLKALVECPSVHLSVVGALPGSPYPALAERLGVAGRTHFLGFRRDVAEIMRASDVFVFPSRYEPFGTVVLEAMASGLPVLTAATVGAAEIVTPESGVVLADSEDVSGLAAALRRMTEAAPAEREKAARAAQAGAAGQTWNHVAESYLALYRKQAAAS